MSLCAPKGKALVICGEEGSGKSSLAQLLARQMLTDKYDAHDTSTFPMPVICSMRELTSPFKPLLACSPEVLIIEEFTIDDLKNLRTLKSLVTNEKVRVELRGENPKYVPSPKHIIVCTNVKPVEFDRDWSVTLTIGGKLCHTPS